MDSFIYVSNSRLIFSILEFWQSGVKLIIGRNGVCHFCALRCVLMTDNVKNKELDNEKRYFIFDDYSTDDVFKHNQL